VGIISCDGDGSVIDIRTNVQFGSSSDMGNRNMEGVLPSELVHSSNLRKYQWELEKNGTRDFLFLTRGILSTSKELLQLPGNKISDIFILASGIDTSSKFKF
jgi:hypothetical protein